MQGNCPTDHFVPNAYNTSIDVYCGAVVVGTDSDGVGTTGTAERPRLNSAGSNGSAECGGVGGATGAALSAGAEPESGGIVDNVAAGFGDSATAAAGAAIGKRWESVPDSAAWRDVEVIAREVIATRPTQAAIAR